MISIMFLAVLLDRPAIALRNVALAALFILLITPESLFDVGFQMSFAAVAALVSAYEAFRDRRRDGTENHRRHRGMQVVMFFGGIILSTLIASAAVAPLGIYHFHTSQHLAVLGNLIAIPICNAIVMPGALATLVALPFGLEVYPLWLMGLGIDGMSWCARAVAALPWAVSRVAAIPDLSIQLIVAGGLWLLIWRRRWRLLGIIAIAAGVGVGTQRAERPDVLIGREGALIAVRGQDGRLGALSRRRANYELSRWLDHEGDERTVREVLRRGIFRCDDSGCVIPVKGTLLAAPRHPVALRDDCKKADILVLAFPKPDACRPGGVIVDFFDLRAKGTHALFITDGRLRIVTVADKRGDRPWSLPNSVARRMSVTASQIARRVGSRVSEFVPPQELAGPDDPWLEGLP